MSSIAASGAVGAVVLVDGADLYVASTGDCSVVLGSISENDTWIAKKLTTEHSTDNPKELKRIQSEHPKEKMRYDFCSVGMFSNSNCTILELLVVWRCQFGIETCYFKKQVLPEEERYYKL